MVMVLLLVVVRERAVTSALRQEVLTEEMAGLLVSLLGPARLQGLVVAQSASDPELRPDSVLVILSLRLQHPHQNLELVAT
jgi:hypothetical protein